MGVWGVGSLGSLGSSGSSGFRVYDVRGNYRFGVLIISGSFFLGTPYFRKTLMCGPRGLTCLLVSSHVFVPFLRRRTLPKRRGEREREREIEP